MSALPRTTRSPYQVTTAQRRSSSASSPKRVKHELYKFGDTLGRISTEPETILTPTVIEAFDQHELRHVTSAWMHTLVTTADGLLYAWGYNEFGQLGMPHRQIKTQRYPDWVQSLESVKVVQAAAARSHSVALTDEGKVLVWGAQEYGQLGDGVTQKVAHEAPKRLESLWHKTVIDIAAGLDHTIALTDQGEVYGWGYNHECQLGVGEDSIEEVSSPTKVPNITKRVTKIFSGMDYSMALTEDGDFYCWGLGEMWQFANGERDLKSTPILSKIPGEKVTDLALGGVSVVALTESGTVYSWGMGSNGRLGLGDEEEKPWPSPITAFPEYGKSIIQIAGRGGHHLALSDDGIVYSWGLGRGGRLGHGAEQDHFLPLPIESLRKKKVSSIAAGLDSSFVVCEKE